MEHFDYTQSPLNKYFIDKLQNIVCKNQNKLKNQSVMPIKKRDTSQVPDNVKTYKSKRNKQFHFMSKLETEMKCEKDLKRSQIEVFETVNKNNTDTIEKSITEQRINFRNRLKNRRVKSFLRSSQI